MTRNELTQWMVARVAQALSVPPDRVDPSQRFTNFGIDSLEAVAITADLEDLLKRRVEPTALWDCPTIAALCADLMKLRIIVADYNRFGVI